LSAYTRLYAKKILFFFEPEAYTRLYPRKNTFFLGLKMETAIPAYIIDFFSWIVFRVLLR